MRAVRIVAYAVILAVMLGGQSSGAMAAGQSDIEKVVFIHYRTAPALPDVAERFAKGAAPCPDPVTCADYSWSRYQWANVAVTYELNPAGSGVAKAASEAAVAAAFGAWTKAVNGNGGSLSVNGSSGATACSTAGEGVGNGVNQVCWRDISEYPNAIAVTYMWGSRSARRILEADVVFNNATGFSWSYTPQAACATYDSCNTPTGPNTAYDIRDIGTHEFGHFLAWLGDLYGTRDANLTMYGYGSKGELKKDSLGKGDCLGITKAYGGTCP